MNSSFYTIRHSVFPTISYGTRIVRDAPSDRGHTHLKFHIASGDYFGTLATILGLIAEALPTADEPTQSRCIATLEELRHDLVYLQNTHRITRS